MKYAYISVVFPLVLAWSVIGPLTGDRVTVADADGGIDVPGKLVVVRWLDPDRPDDVWLLGRSEVNLSDDTDVHENVAFAPDGSIFFSRQERGDSTGATTELWRMAGDGTDQVQLTCNDAVDCHPSVSPDGQKVVYWSAVSGTPHLWSMDADGSDNAELFTDVTYAAFDPEFSPDGSMVVFNQSPDMGKHADIQIGLLNENRDDFLEIWSLTNRGYVAAEVDPTWSPDGLHVTYSSYDGPGEWYDEGINPDHGLDWKIYTIDVDYDNKTGVNHRILVDRNASPNAVSWLPCYSKNGKRVAFIRTYLDPDAWPGPFFFGSSSSELRVVDSDGSNDLEIAGTSGCFWFDWRIGSGFLPEPALQSFPLGAQ